MKTISFILFLLFCINLNAQHTAPIFEPILDGTGIYTGLKKCPQTCGGGKGGFFVSDSDDHTGISYYNTPNTTYNKEDGLVNTKAFINQKYFPTNNFVNNMPLDLNSYDLNGINTPTGPIEVCFRKNYDVNGNLIPGTTPSNMWYLPALNELLLISYYIKNDAAAFNGAFSASTDDIYWSSTYWYGSYWHSSFGIVYTLFVNSVRFSNNKTFQTYGSDGYRVRCTRR